MDKIIEKLRSDEHYYGEFGKKYLSNSDIGTLLKNPLALGQPSKPSAAFLVGGYFHTAILEPHKLKKYKVIKSSTRNTKVYKEMSGGELCLLEHEVDAIEKLSEVNTTVSRMLAIHEERISKQEEVDSILFAKIDKLRDKMDGDNDRIDQRIRQLEKRVWMAIGGVVVASFIMNNAGVVTNMLTAPEPPSRITSSYVEG